MDVIVVVKNLILNQLSSKVSTESLRTLVSYFCNVFVYLKKEPLKHQIEQRTKTLSGIMTKIR